MGSFEVIQLDPKQHNHIPKVKFIVPDFIF
jgi:hypothetical protein